MSASYFVRRTGAAIIDGIFVAILVGLLSAFGLLLAYFGLADLRWSGEVAQTLTGALYLTLGFSWVTNGATLGKRILRLKVVDRDGHALSLHRGFLRAMLLLFLSGLVILLQWFVQAALVLNFSDESLLLLTTSVAASLFLPWSVILGGGRGLHDLVARTYVTDRSHSGPLSLQTPSSIALLAARSLSLALAIAMVAAAVAFAPLLGTLFKNGRPAPFVTGLMRTTLAEVTGEDITQEVQRIHGTLPEFVEHASLRTGVISMPMFTKQDDANLDAQARKGRWLRITIVLAPAYSRRYAVREAMADVAAQYVVARYKIEDVFVLVNTQASTRFGVLSFLLHENFVVKFEPDGKWRVLRPDNPRSVEFGWSTIRKG